MEAVKTFLVFGERVEVLVAAESTQGAFSMIVQHSPPGGGPPLHRHDHEDEIFRVLTGEFELFDGKQWKKVPPGESVHALRGSTHTFRNCGTTPGALEVVLVPGGLERYLEALSPMRMPEDAERILQLSAEYGIAFVHDEAPASAPV